MCVLTEAEKGIGHEDYETIQASPRVVFFGGAGVSTDSGVPDYRSADGIYAKVQGAESILTLSFLQNEPEAFYTFYREYFMLTEIEPNVCHKLLADLEAQGHLSAVITQNVDNLHQKAGSKRVLELHGTSQSFHCLSCHRPYTMADVLAMDTVPRCTCEGILRPDIVLYGEALSGSVMAEAIAEIEQADLLIIGGTSLTVYPAASFVHLQKRQGKKLLIDLGASRFPGLDWHRPMGLGPWSRAIYHAMEA